MTGLVEFTSTECSYWQQRHATVLKNYCGDVARIKLLKINYKTEGLV